MKLYPRPGLISRSVSSLPDKNSKHHHGIPNCPNALGIDKNDNWPDRLSNIHTEQRKQFWGDELSNDSVESRMQKCTIYGNIPCIMP